MSLVVVNDKKLPTYMVSIHLFLNIFIQTNQIKQNFTLSTEKLLLTFEILRNIKRSIYYRFLFGLVLDGYFWISIISWRLFWKVDTFIDQTKLPYPLVMFTSWILLLGYGMYHINYQFCDYIHLFLSVGVDRWLGIKNRSVILF